MAEFCEATTDRKVLLGDFRTIPLPFEPTLIIGNPPFAREFSEGFLERAAEVLPIDGRCGFVLPSTFLSFGQSVRRWRERFSIAQEALPRDLFPRIAYPLSFYTFTRTRSTRRLHGFLLFDEVESVKAAPSNVKMVLVNEHSSKSVWRSAVENALKDLGGTATLMEIYRYLQGRLPWHIRTWRDTIRRVLQEGAFVRVGHGKWALAGA